MTQTVSLSARLRALELDVAELNELRAQRAELDRRIAAGEEAERLLVSVGTLLSPLLDGGQPKAEEGIDDTPAEEEIAAPAIDDEPGEQNLHERGGQSQEPDVQEPPPADAADDLDEEQRQEPEEEPAAPYQLSAGAQVRDWVSGLPQGQEFGAQDCAGATGLAVGTVKGHFGSLRDKGEITLIDGTGLPGNPSRYVRSAPEGAAPAGVPAGDASTLPPIPARLSTDECGVFDVLRRAPAGLAPRLLGARLNWGTSRVERALQRLADLGYVGRNGDHYRVIPEELREGAAD